MTGWLAALVAAAAAVAVAFAALRRRAARPAPAAPPGRVEPPIEPYIGGMAHDFNNLFGIVIGNLDIAVAQNRDPALHEPLKAALDTALRAAQINRRLHMVMRPQPQQPKVLVLDQWIPRLMGELGSVAGDQVRLTSDVAPGLAIRADPDLLLVAIQEILTNAIEAMPQGGTVTLVVTAASPDLVRLAVVDQGGGMSAEARARAFEPFFTTRRGVRGSGLGLSLVHGFAQRAGGAVTLDSGPNGTTVALLLPRADATPKPEPRHGAARVLVVEDNAPMRTLAETYLREFGYQAEAVENAEAALDLLRDGAAFDLLFIDQVLPGVLDGRGLARAAMRLRPGLKCLLTSGGDLSAPDDLPVLPKPYRKDDLARAVRACLGAAP